MDRVDGVKEEVDVKVEITYCNFLFYTMWTAGVISLNLPEQILIIFNRLFW